MLIYKPTSYQEMFEGMSNWFESLHAIKIHKKDQTSNGVQYRLKRTFSWINEMLMIIFDEKFLERRNLYAKDSVNLIFLCINYVYNTKRLF